MGFKIAIDGPAGAGKSYLASQLALSLGILNVNTGAIYRAYALHMLNSDVDINDENNVKEKLNEVQIDQIVGEDGNSITFLNGQNVTDKLKQEIISKSSAVVSKYPSVREKVALIQRNLASKNDVVMEGRDIGSIILPDADVKFFLTASDEIRAMRRYKELIEKNIHADYDSILEGIRQRDIQDTTRKISPLVKAEDAVEVYTDNMTREEVVHFVLELINIKRKEIKN